jgi:hypothetical protein
MTDKNPRKQPTFTTKSVIFGHGAMRKAVLLVLGAIALAGLAAMSVGRLAKVDDRTDGGYPPI